MFALSYEEAEAYLTDSILNTTATEYARAQGAKLRKELPTKYVYWWLRTPGSIPEQAMITRVKASELDYEGNGVGNTFQGGTKNNTGVRPALWLSWSYIDSVRRAELAAASAPYGRLIKNAVGIRQKPDSSSKRLTVTSQGDQVELLGKLTVAGELWYKVSFDGTTGYLKAAMLEVNAAVEVPELSAAD